MGRKNDYTTGNLLDYLSKQIQLENPDLKQQINFIGEREKNEGATMFFVIEKSEGTNFEFSQNSATIV